MTPPATEDPVLRVLLVEDSLDDAALVLIELKRYGLSITAKRVDTADALKEALASEAWDVVISDYTMPGFDGREAMQIVKARQPDLPFIIVSGAVGEDIAVECMRIGATDYLLKDQLARLGAAVERDVREARRRVEERRVIHRRENELRHSEERYRELFENAPVGLGVTEGVIRDPVSDGIAQSRKDAKGLPLRLGALARDLFGRLVDHPR